MGHLSAIGFGSDRDAFQELVARVVNDGEAIVSTRGHYIRWSPGEGVELWIQADGERLVVGCSPHMAGDGRVRFELARLLKSSSVLDGGIYGWCCPDSDARFPAALDLPNFDVVRESFRGGLVVDLQIAAFAKSLHCFLNDLYYIEAQEGESNVPPEAFIPTGLSGINLEELAADPNREHAVAVLSGHVLRSERRTNAATGKEYRYLLVQTQGGTVDMVADPEVITGYPRVGGVVSGVFWLSAVIVSDLPPARKASIFRRPR